MERVDLIGSRTTKKKDKFVSGAVKPPHSRFFAVLSPVRSKRQGRSLWLHPILLVRTLKNPMSSAEHGETELDKSLDSLCKQGDFLSA